MNKWFKALGVLLLLLVLLSAFRIYYAEKEYEDSLESKYIYALDVNSYAVLHNVTLYLPLPIFENKSAAGEIMVFGEGYGKPLDLNFSLVETEHGLMLKLEEEELLPPHGQFRVEIPASSVVNTRSPFGNEPLLFPKYNLHEKSAASSEHGGELRNYEYGSVIYARYDTYPDVEVGLGIFAAGWNEWTLDHKYNCYRDRIDVQLTGPQNGWVPVQGELVTGSGVYRD
jgi:hypothetical protein